MECMIQSIKHTGSRGKRHMDRTDGRYPFRIGRIVDFNPNKIQVGKPMRIVYLKDRDGSDYSNMSLITSNVIDFHFNNGAFTVETMNSIYEFIMC